MTDPEAVEQAIILEWVHDKNCRWYIRDEEGLLRLSMLSARRDRTSGWDRIEGSPYKWHAQPTDDCLDMCDFLPVDRKYKRTIRPAKEWDPIEQ